MTGEHDKERKKALDDVAEHGWRAVHENKNGYIAAEDPLDAVAKASGLIRSCLHAADLGTPGWPKADDLKQAWRLDFQGGPTLTPLIDA